MSHPPVMSHCDLLHSISDQIARQKASSRMYLWLDWCGAARGTKAKRGIETATRIQTSTRQRMAVFHLYASIQPYFVATGNSLVLTRTRRSRTFFYNVVKA